MIWRKPFRTAILLFTVLFLVTGVIYPLIVTGVAELAFPSLAHGSLVYDDKGDVIGSELIGQNFTGPYCFEGRPSSTPEGPDNAGQSGASNLAPSNPALIQKVNLTILHLESMGMKGPWPGDLVTASASGLDPHITLDAALIQVPVVAKARGMSEDDLRTLVLDHVISSPFSPRNQYLNVFTLNRALDRSGLP